MQIITITFTHTLNYGAVLQEYALYKYLHDNGHNVRILNYHDKNITRQYRLIRTDGNTYKDKMINLLKSILMFNRNIIKMYRFKEFEKLLNYTKKYTEKDLNRISTDVLIVGSDQVWNKSITGNISKIYTLNFGNNNIKRLSYAASFGVNEINNEDEKSYAKKLSIIDNISIREESGKRIINKILPKKNCQVVLDPTLLLNQKVWNRMIDNKKAYNNDYIFAYIVEKDDNYYEIVNYISMITGMKVLYIDNSVKNKYGDNSKNISNSGPFEFLYYLKNSKYVITTSFHATAFSIIFKKSFWVIPHKKTGSRVLDLLKDLGLENRIINNIDEMKKTKHDKKIDYKMVNGRLEQLRKKSEQWLQDSIAGDKYE